MVDGVGLDRGVGRDAPFVERAHKQIVALALVALLNAPAAGSAIPTAPKELRRPAAGVEGVRLTAEGECLTEETVRVKEETVRVKEEAVRGRKEPCGDGRRGFRPVGGAGWPRRRPQRRPVGLRHALASPRYGRWVSNCRPLGR